MCRIGLIICLAVPLVTQGQDPKWAFQSPETPTVPRVVGDSIANPIDAFLSKKLLDHGLGLQATADRPTLLRRLSFDLTGLPPTPEEVASFEGDESPDAYERRVDRLLAAPAYGERSAIPWLDLTRFAETDGFKADFARPTAWRYRDYIIDSFNSDKPYGRFVREQIAGDELYPDRPEALVATSMHRHYPDEYNAVNLEQRRQEILNDITDTTSSAFLGLTIGCAKCHDHKFDPIPQKDYYRFQAFFAGWWPAEKPLLEGEDLEKYRADLKAWEEQTAKMREELAKIERQPRKNFSGRKLFRFPKEYSKLVNVPEGERSPIEKQIAAMVLAQSEATADDLKTKIPKESKARWEELREQLAKTKPPEPPKGMAFTDVGPTAPPTHLLNRGNWRDPLEVLEPGFLTSLGGGDPEVERREDSTGRRAALAEWLTRPEHPLTWRVMANRLWQRHFTEGIVASASDFGKQGEPPTHPELLDWLGMELGRDGSLKELSRLMVTSGAYRQGNTHRESAAGVDPSNRLLWRMNRRRLDGEALRDAILSVNGSLNREMSGPSVFPELPKELQSGDWKVSKSERQRDRRSVYVFVKRNLRYPLFSLFDATDRTETCARRFETTTAPQSLMLLNDELLLGEARAFAARVAESAGDDARSRATEAFRRAIGRDPKPNELGAMVAFLEGHREAGTEALTDLCHAILNLNEFVYID